MSLKRKLVEIKDIITTGGIRVRNYEFSEVPENRLYRLHYINYYLNNEINKLFETFKLPLKMNEKDLFIIISYITDFIQKKYNIKNDSFNLVVELDRMLEQFLFVRENDKNKEQVDIFIIDGSMSNFKNSQYYDKYIEWYYPNITFDKVVKIYQKLGLNLEFNPNKFQKQQKI